MQPNVNRKVLEVIARANKAVNDENPNIKSNVSLFEQLVRQHCIRLCLNDFALLKNVLDVYDSTFSTTVITDKIS